MVSVFLKTETENEEVMNRMLTKTMKEKNRKRDEVRLEKINFGVILHLHHHLKKTEASSCISDLKKISIGGYGIFFSLLLLPLVLVLLSFCLSALCDDRDVSAWMWHSWGHPSALHIKALSACASMLIRRKWPSASHMSLHSSDTVCKSFFSPSFYVFFLHTPHLALCFALWTMPLLSVQSEPDTVLSEQASHLWMEATGSCERRGLTASQRIEWPTYSVPLWDGRREMCVSEPYEIKTELQGVTVCMCVCVKERDGVVLQSFGGHNK